MVWLFPILLSEVTLAREIIVHGHRGSRGTHPENTIASFLEAANAGAHVLEMDLQLSRDDVVVVSHEPDITGKLCTDKSGQPVKKAIPIRSLTVKEIAEFDCGGIRQEKFPDQKLIPNTKIPTLESVLEWVKSHAPKVEINIETKMKASKPELVPPPELFVDKILELLRKYQLVDRAILQSFDFRTLEVAKSEKPKLRLACLFEDEKEFCGPTKTLGASIASPNYRLVSEKEVEKCHEMGISVVPWTVNEEKDWQRLIKMGVDGILTDYPRRLVHFLAQLKRS